MNAAFHWYSEIETDEPDYEENRRTMKDGFQTFPQKLMESFLAQSDKYINRSFFDFTVLDGSTTN